MPRRRKRKPGREGNGRFWSADGSGFGAEPSALIQERCFYHLRAPLGRVTGSRFEIPADKVLGTVGRRPRTRGWVLERMAIDMNGHFVKVDDQCRTSMKNV